MVSRISQSTNRPTTVAEIRLEQEKTEKISSILGRAKEKAGRFLQKQIIPTPEPELFAVFRTDGGMTRCLGVLPRRWRNYSALLARHEQTIHAGSRPEKKAVAREIA